MIPHQNPGMHPPSVAATHLPQPVNEGLPVIVGLKHVFPTVTSRHHVVNRAGILEADRSGHVPTNPGNGFLQAQCESARTDPIYSFLTEDHKAATAKRLTFFDRPTDITDLPKQSAG